jgi:hypothetical protein
MMELAVNPRQMEIAALEESARFLRDAEELLRAKLSSCWRSGFHPTLNQVENFRLAVRRRLRTLAILADLKGSPDAETLRDFTRGDPTAPYAR